MMSQPGQKHSPGKSRNIYAYFPQGEKKDMKQLKAQELTTMAEAGKSTAGEIDMLTKADIQARAGRLDNLETGILAKITDLIQPISTKLEQLTLNLQNVASVADMAMETCMLHKEDLRALQDSEIKHSVQLAILGNQQRFFNLKLRGLEESVGKVSDLTIYITNWLATVLDLKGECAPLLTQSYRVGKAHDPKRQFPRDVIITLADVRTKNRIVDAAKGKGYLPHK